MPRNETSAFVHYRTEVEAMLAVGFPFAEVERMLQGAKLPVEESDALWLLAWGLREQTGDGEPVELRLVPDEAATEGLLS
jgi:hypothetical protein